MTAALQTYSRKTATPIDTLIFRTQVKDCFEDGITEAPEDGINCYGLYL